MRKVVFHLYAGVGTDVCEAYLVDPRMTDGQLSTAVYWRALEYAETYGVYPEFDEDEGDYIEGYWEDYDPEKHDGLIYTGSSGDIEWAYL